MSLSFVVDEDAPLTIVHPDGTRSDVVTDRCCRFESRDLRHRPQSRASGSEPYEFFWQGLTFIVPQQFVSEFDDERRVLSPDNSWAGKRKRRHALTCEPCRFGEDGHQLHREEW